MYYLLDNNDEVTISNNLRRIVEDLNLGLGPFDEAQLINKLMDATYSETTEHYEEDKECECSHCCGRYC